MDALLKTIDLKKYFKVKSGALHAVDGVNLEIPRGGTLGVVGESGCGKSTLGRTVIRLQDATAGQILFDGQDITDVKGKQLDELRQKMQIIFQDPYSSLNPRMPVFKLISEPLENHHVYSDHKQINRRVIELMDIVGLARRFVNTYPHEMDGGRRQRIGVARALALNPQFIVCDEPVSALDVSIQAQILNLLMDLQDEFSLTYMFITHDLLVVRHIADEIAVMYLGQCIERAPSKELFKNPLHPYTNALLSSIPVPDLSQRKKSVILHGEVSDPINPKPGCRFASRCQYCREACRTADYPLLEVSQGHYVACELIKPGRAISRQ